MNVTEFILGKALVHFEEQHREEAAREVRGVAGFLNRRAVHTSGKAWTDLKASAREMEQLAERMLTGSEVTGPQFLEMLMRAYRALAEYHHQQAEEVWAERNGQATALQLSITATFLGRATEHAYAQGEDKNALEQVVQVTEALARKLAEGKGYTDEQVDRQITQLGREIDHLNRVIASRRSS